MVLRAMKIPSYITTLSIYFRQDGVYVVVLSTEDELLKEFTVEARDFSQALKKIQKALKEVVEAHLNRVLKDLTKLGADITTVAKAHESR